MKKELEGWWITNIYSEYFMGNVFGIDLSVCGEVFLLWVFVGCDSFFIKIDVQ